MKVLDSLKALGKQLRTIPKTLRNLASVALGATERERHEEDRAIRVRAEVRFTEAAEREHRAEQTNQTSIQWWIARGTWAAFLAASVYACISFCQWREMQKQTINSARAWLGYQQVKDSNLPIIVDRVEISPRLAVDAHYTIQNFGNGPAVKVVPTFWVETDINLTMLKRTAAFICDSSVNFATGTVPMGPGVHNPGPMGFILFPKQTYTDVQSWSGGAMPSLRWMYVMGCVAYIDQFNASHWTRFVVVIGDGRNPIGSTSPQKLYTLYNDTDETGEKD